MSWEINMRTITLNFHKNQLFSYWQFCETLIIEEHVLNFGIAVTRNARDTHKNWYYDTSPLFDFKFADPLFHIR